MFYKSIHSQSFMKFCSFRKLVTCLSTEMVGGFPPQATRLPNELLFETKGVDSGTRVANSLISAFWFRRRLRDVQLFLSVACLTL